MSTQVTVPTVISAFDVEQAVIDTLKPRLDYYLPQLGHPKVRSYARSVDIQKLPEQQTPAITVESPGMEGEPSRKGDGSYHAWWRISVDIFVTAKDADSATRLAKSYIAVIRAVLLQEPGLKGFATGLSWMDETYLELPPLSVRSMATASASFIVEVADVVNARELPYMPGGPAIPTPSGYQVQEAIIEVNEEVSP